jgi:hypothetical protein
MSESDFEALQATIKDMNEKLMEYKLMLDMLEEYLKEHGSMPEFFAVFLEKIKND